MSTQLTEWQFQEVFANAPLVSIDLVVRDERNRLLLGYRKNSPAQRKWFVPGGRIYKGETLDSAFGRISLEEINEQHSTDEARFIGVYSHFYATNPQDAVDCNGLSIPTHYVVLAYELCVDDRFKTPDESAQHYSFAWVAEKQTEPDSDGDWKNDVHEYVRAYFREPSQMSSKQYELLNARRDSFNNLVWQTPIVSLAAQAFLFHVILSSRVNEAAGYIACSLSLIASIGSLHLMIKHRRMEEAHAKILHDYEQSHGCYGANRRFEPEWGFWPRRSQFRSRRIFNSSYIVWKAVMWAFFVAAATAMLLMQRGLL